MLLSKYPKLYAVSGMNLKPKRLPEPNISLTAPTIAKMYAYPSPLPMPSRKLSHGAWFMAKASSLPMSIQLVIINPTYTDSCTLTSYATALSNMLTIVTKAATTTSCTIILILLGIVLRISDIIRLLNAVIIVTDSPMTMALDTDADLVWTKYGDSLVNELASDNARQQLSGEEIKDFHASNSYDLKHNGRLVLAPFWFVYYTYNNQRYYYIMDGLGENNTMSTPVDQNEVNFVNGKERIKKIVNWCWPLAIVMWWLINFTAAIITLVVWFIAKIVVKKVMDSQIQKHLDASRAARADAAAKLG